MYDTNGLYGTILKKFSFGLIGTARRRMAYLYLLLGLCVFVVSAEIRGIDPSQTGRYNKPRFVCFDESREIPYEAVNDDYCDCLDGSDEPGTAACAEGVFYCRNKGFRPSTIASFFVDDGVCDCCDGSDEKNGTCQHTCYALGEKIRVELKQKIDIYERSLKETNRRANEAEGIKEKWRQELKTCEDDIEKQQAGVSELKARLDVLEEEEQRKEDERIAKESAGNTTGEDDTADDHETEVDPDFDSEVEKENKNSTEEDDTEVGASVETLHDDEGEDEHEIEDEQEGTYHDGGDDQYDEAVGHTDEALEKDNDADDSDGLDDDHEQTSEETSEQEEEADDHKEEPSMDTPTPPLLTRLKQWGRSLWPPGKKSKTETEAKKEEDVPVEDLKLQQLRKEHATHKKDLRNMKQRRDDLRSKLDRDYGSDSRFISLVDRCFELKQDKYTYAICPFDHADQKEGHKNVNLGRFDGFSDDYRTMYFKNGQHCPGKQRSLTVNLNCGEEESIQSVLEPAMCEYSAEFTTPVACNASDLKQLKKEARLMGVEGIEDTETKTHEDSFKDEL